MRALKGVLFISYLWFCDGILTFPNYINHPCKRPCNGTRMKCSYKFVLERMFSMEVDNCKKCMNSSISDCLNPNCIVADGRQKLLYTINRQVPGPRIEVCKGDVISALITNYLSDDATSMHWHGQHQVETPYMDGVPMVTQCPIPPGSKFLYEFEATEQGTHFYHSHLGSQRMDGLSSALIVRIPDEDNKIRQYYDYDLSSHVLQVTDWSIREAIVETYNQYRNKFYGRVNSAILINGFGSTVTNDIPFPIFRVKKGFRYRFRLIHSGSSSCTISISINGHFISVASSDGGDLNPQEVEVLTLTAGERYDFILNANQPEDFYWIKATGDSQCMGLESLALLKYEAKNVTYIPTKDTVASDTKRSIEFNSLGVSKKAEILYTWNNVTSVNKLEPSLAEEPDFKYTVGFTMKLLNPPRFKDLSNKTIFFPLFNNIASPTPSSNLLEGAKNLQFCNRENMTSCDPQQGFCECLHMVELPYKKNIEILLVNEENGFIHHPIHLHGYNFRVLAHRSLGREITVSEIEEMDRRGLLERNYNNPPVKDTIAVPPGGYSIVRFTAYNEGYWLMHCHVEYHMQLGMEMIFKVGNPKHPPKNFPKCGDYTESTFDFKKVL